MPETTRLQADIPIELDDKRLDQIAARLFPDYSRSRLKNWIESGDLTVDGEQRRPRDRLRSGQRLELSVFPQQQGEWQPEAISLDIRYQDDDIIVLNKPVGLVVHPAAGHAEGTLLNALLHVDPELLHVPRAGIVHRLDKDTSGLMVVARTLSAHTHLVDQLQRREVYREYQAVVQGLITAGGTVNAPLGRHPRQRQKMAVLDFGGKEAITHYRVRERFFAHTLVSCRLETGRTHQIRVHMASIHHPLVGDSSYGGRIKLPKGASDELLAALRSFPRQALHAHTLGLIHPRSGEAMQWQADLPDDMQQLIELLRQDAQARL